MIMYIETRTYFHSLPEVKAIFFLMLAYKNTTPRKRSAYYLSRSNGEESDDSDDEETPRAETPSMIKRRDYHTFLSDAFDRIEETSCNLYTEETKVFPLYTKDKIYIPKNCPR